MIKMSEKNTKESLPKRITSDPSPRRHDDTTKNNNDSTLQMEDKEREPTSYYEESLQISYSNYSGGAIPPEFAEKWEKVVPGAAKTILDLSISEVEHRRQLQKIEEDNSQKRANRGQIFGFTLAITSVVSALIIALFTKLWLLAVLLFVCGIGGPLAAQTIARTFNLRKTESEDMQKE